MDKDWAELLPHIRKKRQTFEEIFRMTKELDDCFKKNDPAGAEYWLDLRGEEILAAQRCDERMEELLDKMELQKALRLTKIMRLQGNDMEMDPSEKMLSEMFEEIKSIVDKTMEYDRRLSRHIGGKLSVYHQEIAELK